MNRDFNDVNCLDKKRHGMVFKKTMGQYFVRTNEDVVVCSVSSKLRKRLIYPTADPSSIRPHVVKVKEITMTDPIAIGDEVGFIDEGDGTGMITEILPRKNKFNRRAAGRKPLEQVIATNVNQIVIVVATTNPTPKWRMLDRYLADAEFLSMPSLICITKMDLVSEDFLSGEIQTYEKVGYPIVFTSAITNVGVEQLKRCLKNRISVLVGKSGVGKTTLLNVMQPGLGLKVKEVSGHTKKGKHVTSHLEMYELDFGGGVIDTPGMRELGLWRTNGLDIASLFPEMRLYIGLCRFGLNCSHTHEPGCAIKQAVKKGDIAEHRYESYLRMNSK